MQDASGIFAPDQAESVARTLLPADVAVSLEFPWNAPDGLLSGERASLGRPNARRLAEFAAGRRAIHCAMDQLGVPVSAVPMGTDRAPVWPAGVVGSVSHSDMICLAILGNAERYAALALDVEEDADLPDDILTEVCSKIELAWLSVQDPALRGRLARLIFSAKECAYKLQYPLSGQLLGFDAFEITPDLETGQFEATLTAPVPPFDRGDRFGGHYAFDAGMLVTAMSLSRAAQSQGKIA